MLVPMGSSDDFLRGRLAAILSAVRSGSNRPRRRVRAPDAAQRAVLAAWCAADPGPMDMHRRVPAQRSSVKALHRVRDRYLIVLPSNKKAPAGAVSNSHHRRERSVRVGPDFLLGEIHQSREYDQE